MQNTITATVGSKQKKLSNGRMLTASIIIDFAVGIRIEVNSISRVTKQNGFSVNTECAYRHQPATDIQRIVLSKNTQVFNLELVQGYVEYLESHFQRFVREAEDHYQTIESL